MATSDWVRFFFLGWGLSFTIYVAVQLAAVLLSRGRYRWLAVAPVPFVILVSLHAVEKYYAASSLWPVLLIITSTIAAVFCLVMMVGALITRRKVRSTEALR